MGKCILLHQQIKKKTVQCRKINNCIKKQYIYTIDDQYSHLNLNIWNRTLLCVAEFQLVPLVTSSKGWNSRVATTGLLQLEVPRCFAAAVQQRPPAGGDPASDAQDVQHSHRAPPAVLPGDLLTRSTSQPGGPQYQLVMSLYQTLIQYFGKYRFLYAFWYYEGEGWR